MLDSPVADEITIKNLKIIDEMKSQQNLPSFNHSDAEAVTNGWREDKQNNTARNRNQNL